MRYLRLLKKLRALEIDFIDWGMGRIFTTSKKVYTFTYRDKPNSNANDIIHLMIKPIK
jgi:hypothetical protein